MDNNNKSKLFRQESPKKYSDKRMILQNQSHINKKQSADLNLINSVYKSRNTQNNKLNKIPFNIRSTYQEKSLNPNLNFGNIESSNISGNKVIKVKDKGTPVKKDKNYYLNLLNDIYLNDSHYSNKNTVKSNNNNSINNSNFNNSNYNNSIISKSINNYSINDNSINNNSINKKRINNKKEKNDTEVNKKFMKKKTNYLSKGRGSKDSFRKSYKSYKITINYVNNENRSKSKKLSINDNKDNINKESNRKFSNFSKEIISNKQEPKILSEKAISKLKNPENSMKDKTKDIYTKFKSSQNINIINEIKNDDTLKEEKNENNETMQKEIKSIKININNNENNIINSKRSRNIVSQNENSNLARCNTKINSNKNIQSDKSIKIKKVKKMYKTCFFCCLIKNDESFSDND